MKIVVVILIVIIGVGLAFFMTKEQKSEKQLPIIQPIDLNNEMVDPSLLEKGIGHRIGDFSFKNQHDETITLDSLKGTVFVVEYFFTTCGTICPRMTEQMTRIQEKFRKNNDVKLLSFTVNPDYDSVGVLFGYAEKHHAEKGQWHFLTGEKTKLYELARKSFFVLKPAEAANLGDAGSDFIHTNNFVLVDQSLRIRGYYDGTSFSEVDELMSDISTLLSEK